LRCRTSRWFNIQTIDAHGWAAHELVCLNVFIGCYRDLFDRYFESDLPGETFNKGDRLRSARSSVGLIDSNDFLHSFCRRFGLYARIAHAITARNTQQRNEGYENGELNLFHVNG
jgi:hypothetical protein